MQRRGAAAGLVVTHPFAGVLTEHLAAWRPDHAVPLVLIAHPIQDLREDDLAARARELARGILDLLDQDSRQDSRQDSSTPTPNA